jgi:hypothetical protein
VRFIPQFSLSNPKYKSREVRGMDAASCTVSEEIGRQRQIGFLTRIGELPRVISSVVLDILKWQRFKIDFEEWIRSGYSNRFSSRKESENVLDRETGQTWPSSTLRMLLRNDIE